MASATELCNQANEQYVNEDYQRAVELYSEALSLDSKRDDIYCHRAQAYLQLGKPSEAAADCDVAIQLNENNNKAYIKKGSALYQMDEVGKALDVFNEGYKKFQSDPVLQDWISKCQVKLHKSPADGDGKAKPSEAAAVSGPAKVRHEWYQTHTHVVVTVLVKNVKKEALSVIVEDRSLQVTVKDYNGSDVTLDLTLAHKIDADRAETKLFASKVEIKLKKLEGIQWAKLEGAVEEESLVNPTAAVPMEAGASRYPSSSHYTRDWDKLAAEVVAEEKNEKLEGDAGLNQFFQNIYADASDETKKAMMKSFSESGGTVLSTNWDEVGSKKVEVKPPDGMEYKTWEH